MSAVFSFSDKKFLFSQLYNVNLTWKSIQPIAPKININVENIRKNQL